MSQRRYRLKLRRPPRDIGPQVRRLDDDSGPWCVCATADILWDIRPPSYDAFSEYDDAEFQRELESESWREYAAGYPNGIRDAIVHLAQHDGYEIECWGAEADRWVPVSGWRLEDLRRARDLTAMLAAKRKGGRPRGDANGRCLRAHQMRVHEQLDNDDVARELYSDLYARNPAEARHRASDAASKGCHSCPACRKNPPS